MYDEFNQYIYINQYNMLYQTNLDLEKGIQLTMHVFITLVDKIAKSLDNVDIVIGVFIG